MRCCLIMFVAGRMHVLLCAVVFVSFIVFYYCALLGLHIVVCCCVCVVECCVFGACFVSYVCCLSLFCHVCVMCVLSDCVVGGCVCCCFCFGCCVLC